MEESSLRLRGGSILGQIAGVLGEVRARWQSGSGCLSLQWHKPRPHSFYLFAFVFDWEIGLLRCHRVLEVWLCFTFSFGRFHRPPCPLPLCAPSCSEAREGRHRLLLTLSILRDVGGK